MKQIKIFFEDYGKKFDKTEELIIKLLRKKYEVILTPQCDYLFYACDGYKHLDPKYRHCIKIFYTAENLFPDFNFCDYALSHGHIQIGDRHYRMPYYMLDREFGDTVPDENVPSREFEKMNPICPLDKDKALNRKFCCFLSSSGWADPIRYEFFKQLSEYKRIDSGGRSMNNMGNIKIPNKMRFLQEYKFTMAFENSSVAGYTTEKLTNAMAANTVPIYFGDPEVGLDFNKDAFICIQDFPSIEEAVAEIIRLDQDDEKYLEKLYTPRFTGANYQKWEEGLFHFLDHIMEQPFEKAFRTTQYGKMYSHSRDMSIMRILFSKNRFIAQMIRKALRLNEKRRLA